MVELKGLAIILAAHACLAGAVDLPCNSIEPDLGFSRIAKSEYKRDFHALNRKIDGLAACRRGSVAETRGRQVIFRFAV